MGGYQIQYTKQFCNFMHAARAKSLFQHHMCTMCYALEAVTPLLSCTVVRGSFSQTYFGVTLSLRNKASLYFPKTSESCKCLHLSLICQWDA